MTGAQSSQSSKASQAPSRVPQSPEVMLDASWDPSGWRLHSRIAVALLSVGLLLLGVVASAVSLELAASRAQHLVIIDYYHGLKLSQNYYVAMLTAQSDVRGYALSGNRTFLDPLNTPGQPWQTPISPQVAVSIPKEETALAALKQVEASARAWYQQWAAPSIAQVDAGRPLTPAQVEAGDQLFSKVQTGYTTYITMARAGREQAAHRVHELTNLLFVTVILAALIAVVGGLLLWQLMRRWVSKPVALLAAEARTVSGGELSHQVTAQGPPEFVGLGADVEAMRQRLVAQIAKAEDARREVAAARSRLEEQAEELQRSNRELEQFAYVASHDLQEPLRKVASFCQMLQRRYSGKLDERADQYIHFAVDGAQRMQQLINDLLEYSRVGRLSAPRVEVSLMACLRTALGNLQAAREESGAVITTDDLPDVLGEAPLLTQLLQNLLGNAIKFHGEQPPLIHLGFRRTNADWEFWCSDNGIGIEPEYADRVFLIFQRLHAKEVYTGTGIGLAMCKKIVEHHGGRIWVDQTARLIGDDGLPAGHGTTVRWTLPVITESAGAGSASLGRLSAADPIGHPS